VSAWPFGRERRYVLRAYVVLAGGLMLVALVLDLAFARLQAPVAPEADPWIGAALGLVESRLASASADERPAIVRQLATELGMGVALLDGAAVSGGAPPVTQLVADSDGNAYYLRPATRFDGVLRVGPVPEPAPSVASRLLPALFYLSILAIVWLWLRPLLADVRELTAATRRFAADYREPLDTARRTTQLTSLARDLDDMSRRLGRLIENQKALTAALSHEMRTPLARIRFALAVAGNDADARVRSELGEINADVAQIDALIASLLDYARLDHPDLRMEWQEVALGPWLQDIALAAAGTRRDVRVDVDGGDRPARFEPRLMRLAVSNLVANAARYARERIRVVAERDASHWRIVVEDDGPGIPEDRRADAFRAYTRLDPSRDGGTGGFGLGLAIVARVAALHGGDATASASAGLGGARVTVTWPVMPP
jgi:two-component system OmpR family sensor kinase